MAHIRQVPDEEATGELKRVYQAGQARAGKVANIIRVMSLDASSLKSSMGFYVSLMKTDNALAAPRREMLAAVTSNVNDCFY
jgi:alkylhydroperoxidase family enzyme